MAEHDSGQNPQNSSPDSQKPGLAGAVERFKALPKNVQLGIMGLVGFMLLMVLLRSGGHRQLPPPVVQQAAQAQQQQAASQGQSSGNDSFAPVTENREALRRGFVNSQELELARLRSQLKEQQQTQQQAFDKRTQEMQQLQQQLQATMKTLNDQMRTMEDSNSRQREEIAHLAEEARRQGLAPGSVGGNGPIAQPQKQPMQRITQTPLGSGVSSPGGGQALLQGVLGDQELDSSGRPRTGKEALENPKGHGGKDASERKPFIPPLGFVKGTLLNGVDALASSGIATPALVRLQGVYKTAMNSTVILDGCFMLVEFEGDISTERAKGKPSRMTCVYPDRGAVTYDVTGYVVDAEDGLEGVPGIFFEGDSGRIALAIASQFASSVAQVVASNQSTTSTSALGTTSTALTGSQTKAAVAGGVSGAMSRLTDYLVERAERIAPFVRIDATRQIHIVLLSGTELRSPQGDAWSLLFDANDDK